MDTATASPSPAGTRNRRWRAKQAQILAAAERMFMAHGYAGASMDAIAAAAGVSKQTLYHHHGSKESLFAAIVDARVDRLLLSLGSEDLGDRPPQEALQALGRDFLEIAVSPASTALHRAVVTEAPRRPELGRTVFEHGPARAVRVLATYLRRQTESGRLNVPDAELAAEQFYGMTLGHHQLRALLAADSEPSRAERERAVDAAVRVFVCAYAGTAPDTGV